MDLGTLYVMIHHLYRQWSDLEYLLFGAVLVLPLYAIPIIQDVLNHLSQPKIQPWFRWDRHIWKFNVAILVTTVLQAYFGSEIFFHVLGMKYKFSSGKQFDWNGTPLFLYGMTVTYFSTYYVVLDIAWRVIQPKLPREAHLIRLLALTILCSVIAFGEHLCHNTELIRDVFSYRDHHFTLTVGSVMYGILFVVTFPVFHALGERGNSTFTQVVWDVCAAMMIVLVIDEGFLSWHEGVLFKFFG